MDVKVCNLRSNSFGSDFKDSLIKTGFAVVTRHGIDSGLISDMQQIWREFFLADQQYKNEFSNAQDPNQGYKGMKTEKAVGATKPDLKEFYHWRPSWIIPDDISSLTQQMFYQLEDVSGQLLGVIDELGDTNYRKECENSDNTILRTIYYPAMDFDAEPGAVRSAAHEDINHITLLVAASAPGLQVKDKEGKWYDVPHKENSIVVNVGDMLQLSSGGRLGSTTHRVVNPDNNSSDRVSMPLFVHPHSSTVLKDGFTAGQFLAQRIAEIHQQVKP